MEKCVSIERRIHPHGDGYTYTYDCMDRLTSVTNPLGEAEAVYRYDHEGRITGYHEGKGKPDSIYTYNHAGWLTSVRVPVEEACSHNSCEKCSKKQADHHVRNITGTKEDKKKIGRDYVSDLWE